MPVPNDKCCIFFVDLPSRYASQTRTANEMMLPTLCGKGLDYRRCRLPCSIDSELYKISYWAPDIFQNTDTPHTFKVCQDRIETNTHVVDYNLVLWLHKYHVTVGHECFVCVKSLSYEQCKWVKLKSKLKQGSNIYSILLWC